MGGRGVLYLAYNYPDRFAAVAALAPFAPVTAWAEKLASTPTMIIHGERDPMAPIGDSEELAGAIRNFGGTVVFSRLAGRDHAIADVYETNEVYEWLLQFRR